LFSIVSKRYAEALDEQGECEDPLYIETSTERKTGKQLAGFNIAEDEDDYHHERGMFIRVRVPIFSPNEIVSGLVELSLPERFFIVTHTQGGQSRSYRVTSSEVAPDRTISGHHKLPHIWVPEGYESGLVVPLNTFKLVTAHPDPRLAGGNKH
jgi:hypothetical protein